MSTGAPSAIPPSSAEPGLARSAIDRAIDSFQAGVDREESFRVVFDGYFRPLQRFFARKGLPLEVCLDLTQETLLGIYQGLGSYRREARFETWLYRIATTTYLKKLRAEATEKRSGVEVSTVDEEGRERDLEVAGEQLDGVLSRERRAALHSAIGELPDQMRRCLQLRIDRGSSYREIAVALQISIETVKAHLFQGRQKLKRRLADFSEP